jgi:hypothetical protein
MDQNNPDHPVYYTRGTAMRMTVKIEVDSSKAGTAVLRVVGPDGVTGEHSFAVTCGKKIETVTISTSVLPGVVKCYTPMNLSWSVKAPGETSFTPIGSTPHRTYVAFGTPGVFAGNRPTRTRLDFVCFAAAQSATALEVIDGNAFGGDGIHFELSDDPPFDPNDFGTSPPFLNDWQLMAGPPQTGECHDQAHLMHLALQLIGIGGGNVYLTFASTDTNVTTPETRTASDLGYTIDLDGDGVVGNETFTLIFDFDPPTGNWNNFEGSISVAARYYAVWPSFEADSECALYQAIVAGEDATQSWVFPRPDGALEVYPTSVPGPTTCP